MTVAWVRPLFRADLPAVLAIEKQANPVPWMEADFAAFLREPDSVAGGTATGATAAGGDHMGWVWADPQVQGFICAVAAADEAELQTLAVARDRWGRGAGSALMETACAWARARGCKAVHLEVREGNDRALAFYTRWGFQATGRRPKYYRDNGETALLLTKML